MNNRIKYIQLNKDTIKINSVLRFPGRKTVSKCKITLHFMNKIYITNIVTKVIQSRTNSFSFCLLLFD